MSTEDMRIPDVLFIQLGESECYIFKENGKFKAQVGLEHKSEAFLTPGECLNWILRTWNHQEQSADPSNATLVEITDASELYEQGSYETE